MLKKFLIILISILLIIGMCGNVNAAELKTSLDIIQKASEIKYLENNQGFIEKQIVNSNSSTGEVTIELKINNFKKEIEKRKATEIFIVFDNSTSMEEEVSSGITRRKTIIDSAKKLITKIFDECGNVKIGLVKFSSQYEGEFDGKMYSQSNAATLLNGLSNSKENILNKIETYENSDTEAGTNIYEGLKLATQNFTNEDNNKLIILLTDGFPTEFEQTYDDDLYVKQIAIEKTREYLKNMNQNITLISLLSGTARSSEAIRLFGTESNPTNGKFYNITDENIDKAVTESISADITEIIQNPINMTRITDYFPEEITENFEFSFVGSPNIGTVTDKIDTETKTITWDIGTLKGNEVATLKYKLKIKDVKNTDLLNKTIATNKKVVLTYKDTESKDYTVELTSSPKIQLSEVKEELTATVTYDPTTNTTGKVTATIKTNKKVNEVEGWTLSEDGMILTKEYSTNATETVHLIDIDNMTKDVVVKISNIIKEEPKQPPKDETTVTDKLPQTGVSATIIISLIAVTVISIIIYKKYNSYKDIK